MQAAVMLKVTLFLHEPSNDASNGKMRLFLFFIYNHLSSYQNSGIKYICQQVVYFHYNEFSCFENAIEVLLSITISLVVHQVK